MSGSRSHPAVFAGLVGCACWGTPRLALAIPVDEVVDALDQSLLLQLVVGCAAGVAAAGVISLVSERVMRDDASAPGAVDALPDAEGDPDHWGAFSSGLLRSGIATHDDDPTGDLGRLRTGQITIDAAALAELAPTAGASGRRPGRHFAPVGPRHLAAAHVVSRDPARRVARHLAASGTLEQPSRVPLVAALRPSSARSVGRHFAGRVGASVAEAAEPLVAEVAAQLEDRPRTSASEQVAGEEAAHVSEPEAASPAGRERLAQLPLVESRYAKLAAALAPGGNAPLKERHEDLGQKSDDAARDVARAERKDPLGITGRILLRFSERTKDVREVLAERLGFDDMDGIPIIERADGSTSQLDLPAWRGPASAPARPRFGVATGAVPATGVPAPTGGQRPAPAGSQLPRPAAGIDQEDPSRASYIARHVAEVNLGVFPERRSADELEHGDVWEEALAAMGETIAGEAPVFQDVVGGPSTIDDPDGLEGPTGFIPFRVPAAHPEVVDTSTYVDYLLRDELSHNSSEVLRRSTHAHLRVIEGGTSSRLVRRRAGEKEADAPRGRHFVQQRYVREA